MIEMQDEGSQIAALFAGEAREQVLDLCAGAGGKTLALAAMMALTASLRDRRRQPATCADL